MSTKPNYKLRKTVLGTASVLTGFAVAGTLTAGTAEAVVIQAGNGKEILLPVNVQEKGKGLEADSKPEVKLAITDYADPMIPGSKIPTGTKIEKPDVKVEAPKVEKLKKVEAPTGTIIEKPDVKVEAPKFSDAGKSGGHFILLQDEKGRNEKEIPVTDDELQAYVAPPGYKGEGVFFTDNNGVINSYTVYKKVAPEAPKPEATYPTGKGTGVTVDKPELKVPTEKGAGVTADPKSELHLIPNIKGAFWGKTESLTQDAKPEVTGLKGSPLFQNEKPELSETLVAETEKGTGETAYKPELHLIPNIKGAFWGKTESLTQDTKPELPEWKLFSLKAEKPELSETLVAETEKGFGETAYKPELHLIPNIKGAHWAKTEALTQDAKTELPVSALLALAPEKPELDPSLLFSTSEPASAPGITSPVTPEPKPEGELSTGNTNKDVKVEGKKEVKSGKVKGTKAEGKVLPKTSATTATSVALPLGLAAALLTVGLISLRRKNN